jgi:hypothetical protein
MQTLLKKGSERKRKSLSLGAGLRNTRRRLIQPNTDLSDVSFEIEDGTVSLANEDTSRRYRDSEDQQASPLSP